MNSPQRECHCTCHYVGLGGTSCSLCCFPPPQREGCCIRCAATEKTGLFTYRHFCGNPKCKCHTPTPPIHEGGSEEFKVAFQGLPKNWCPNCHTLGTAFPNDYVCGNCNYEPIGHFESFISKTRQEAIEEGEAKGVNAEREKIKREIRKWWRFDESTQFPRSSWHDREDFIGKFLTPNEEIKDV